MLQTNLAQAPVVHLGTDFEMKRVRDARVHLILNFRFFGALALRLQVEAASIGSMDVDGVTLRFDPAFSETLPFDELVGVVAHEVLHCAAGHHARRGGRDPETWNIACDLAINPLVIAAGLKLPQGALFDPEMVDDKGQPLAAEAIYTRLKQRQQPPPPPPQDEQEQEEEPGGDDEPAGAGDDDQDDDQGEGEGQGDDDAGGGAGGGEEAEGEGEGQGMPGEGGSGEGQGEPVGNYGGCGSFRDAPVETGVNEKTAQEAAARAWDIATMQAVAAAKGAGDLPGAGAWLVDQAQAAKADWRDILRDFIQVRSRSHATWNRPNRRHLHRGMYLPSRDSKRIGELVVITDASGSTWGPLQDQFAAELNAIVADTRPRMTHVVYWDTQCQGHEEIEPDDLPLTLEAKGGGGTIFTGIWEWIDDQGIDPACVVVLTDLDCRHFGDDHGYPILWATTEKTYAPFGEVVELRL
jgi:predicted metal-dependent peptidase